MHVCVGGRREGGKRGKFIREEDSVGGRREKRERSGKVNKRWRKKRICRSRKEWKIKGGKEKSRKRGNTVEAEIAGNKEEGTGKEQNR